MSFKAFSPFFLLKKFTLISHFLAWILLPSMGVSQAPELPWVISVFGQYKEIIKTEQSVLLDLAKYINESNEVYKQYENDNQLFNIFKDQGWVIGLGGPYGPKLFFELLKDFNVKNPNDKTVIHRTLETSPNIEYYAVPNSYILVYVDRLNLGYHGTGTYNIMVPPSVWRESFSVSSRSASTTNSGLVVPKNYSRDIVSVIKQSSSTSISCEENWNMYSSLIRIITPRVY